MPGARCDDVAGAPLSLSAHEGHATNKTLSVVAAEHNNWERRNGRGGWRRRRMRRGLCPTPRGPASLLA
eukprot:4830464-Pyramimonas_sp.AAC.1